MTFPSGGSVFDEELQCVKHYFEKWSHCERAIAVCSMLKQFQYPTLRFIHSKIEATYAQSIDCDKNKRMEQQSNDKSYIYELCDSYKSLTNINSDVQLNNNNKDSIYYESDRLIIGDNNSTNSINSNTINNNNNNNNYSNNNANSTSIKVNLVADKFSTKEEILKEILNCILMLKIGNDDVIQEYLALIPFMVNDTERRIINVQVVMQTLSILVAHPALSSDDLRTVKEHIERLKKIIQEQNGQLQNADWQAVVRPMYSSYYKNPANNIFSSLSSVGSSQIHNENIYDTQSDYIETDSGSAGRSSGGGSDFIPYLNLSNKPYPSDDIFLINASDDQNNSFSKNGTEIPDYPEYHEFNSDQPMHQKVQNACQFATNLTHKLNPLIDSMLKTRRSNSLTTGGLKHNDAFLGLSGFTSSTENLLHLHKPRSCSLSIENPRLLMTASGSETRLDDLKPTYQAFQTQNIGMKYVYPWLKRLRLHKYYTHFENFTYEQMMDVTDEFLNQLGVTQGARTKLVNSIQKLKERFTRLTQTEQELKSGKTTPDTAIKLLHEIVETPMKPIEIYDTIDVTVQFLNLLTVVCKIMVSKQIGPQDEESVKQLIQIFDIAQLENVEPFLQHANQLKDLRYDIDVIRMKFPPKSQYHKSGSGSANGSLSKPRWSSATKLHNKNGSETKPHRKNSNPISNFNFVSMQQVQKQPKSAQHLGSKSKPTQQRSSRQSEFNNNYHPTPTSSYSKSSSYPNFGSNGSSAASSNGSGQQYANVGNQNATPQLHHSYHRHSVSNLITITPAKTTVTITPTAPITQHQKTSSCIGLHLSSQSTPHSSLSNSSSNSTTTPITSSSLVPTMHYCPHQCSAELTPVSTIGRSSSTGGGSYPKQAASKHLLGDISPYRDLEFLSLQMTEQAIN